MQYQIVEQGSLQNEECLSFKSKKNRKKKVQISSKDEIRFKKIHYLQYEQISNLSNIQLQKDILSKELQIIHGLDNNNSIKNQNCEKYRQMYYKFFQNVIPNPEKYVYDIPSTKEFQRHKIKYLTGNKYQQNLQSFQKPFIRVKYTERSANIVVYTVIIAMFELEITLLNIDSDANTQQMRIGKGSFGSVRVQSENNRMFAVKRQIFKNKCNLNEFRMMANKYEIEQAIIQLAIYKICSLLKIGPAAETDIGFDLICYRDCIEFQLELCLKIEFRHGIYVDKSKFQKQIKQSLFILHQFKIIHKDIKPANILFSIKYNKYVFTDFGISHPVIQQIGQYSKIFLQGTFEYISQEMGNIISGQMGWVHLFGNDIHALSVVLKKQMMDLKIEQGLKYFIYKYQKQLITNHQYQYLKLKYYCIKPNHQINHSLSYWKCMDNKRKVELISIVSRSMDFDKIQTVYNQLSKLKQYEDCDLQSLRKQTTSIKQINIYLRSQQEKYNLSQIYLKNNLRTYGYSQKVKTIIQNLKLEQKYPKTMQIIRKIKEKQYYPSETDQLFDSYNYYRRYSRKLKQEIIKYQKLNDKKSMFQNYILLLEYCNNQNEIDEIIENLQILKYKRTKIQKIKEKILINYRIKNKQYLEDFLEEMEINPRQKNSIIQQLKLNMQVGQIYHYLDKYQIALKYYFRAQKQYKYRSISPYLAQIYYRIGYTYSKICQYKQALNYFNISLNMKILLVGQDHPNVACLYQNFAYIYFEKGIYETALSYYIKSLNITMKYEEQQHETLSIIYNNIAMVYQRLDKYQMGLYNCNKILKIDESYFGKINPNLALTYNNIGAIYNQMENYNEALEYLNKSLKICIELYGQKYISFSAILFNIGLVYKKMGQYEIALNYFIKSLKINIQRFGRKHNKVALNYDNLGYTYLKLKKYQRALQILERNISTWNQIEEQQNINVAVTYSYIAKVYQNRKQYKIALYYFEKAFKIDSIYFDPLHPYIAQSKNHIGQIYCILGRYDQALANYLDCLQIYKKLNDTRVANLYNNRTSIFPEE